MKKKNIVPVSYKKAINRIESYHEAVKSGKELQNEDIEKFEVDIAPFLTQKGELRKGLSQKKLEQFNKIVSDFKASKVRTNSKVAQLEKQIMIENAIKKGTYTRAEAKAVSNLMSSNVIRELIKNQYLDSEQVVKLGKTFEKISKDDVKSLNEFLKKNIESKTPSEASEFINSDDTYKEIESFLYDELEIEDDESEIPFT